MSSRSYEDAVNTLNTLQSNAAVLEKIRAQSDKRCQQSLSEMLNFITRAGLTLDDLDKLNVIHVSGTKGKGSTCAFSESILRTHGLKTGFYSSPHLIEVRERIRIGGKSLSKKAFTKYFWQVYDRLNHSKNEFDGAMPAYFRFLTILAFHVFREEKVDVAVVEVGIGGEYDCTNIVRCPVVCGVASLGIDHTSCLGDTIDKIAWHKAGIFKSDVTALTVPQSIAALSVLQERALEKGCKLLTVPPLASYSLSGTPLTLGIPGTQQSLNASLALQLCRLWLDKKFPGLSGVKDETLSNKINEESVHTNIGENRTADGTLAQPFTLTQKMAAGLQACNWPGRCQKISGPNITYYLDGAHTDESIELCSHWFRCEADKEATSLRGKVVRVLLFNTTGDRNSHSLLSGLVKCKFDYAVFCPNIQSLETNHPDIMNKTVSLESQLRRCQENRQAWIDLRQNHKDHQSDDQHTTCSQCDSNLAATEGKQPSTVGNSTGDNYSQTASIPSENNNKCLTSDNCNERDNYGSLSSTMTFDTILDSLVWVSRGQDARLKALVSGSQMKISGQPIFTADHVQVLCTGSLILVGNILGLLDPDVCDRIIGAES